METECKTESGLQLLHRLNSRLSLNNLYEKIFPYGGPLHNEVVEITGDTNLGKTVLITEIIARSILPTEYGGKNVGVLFLNTDHDFSLMKLIAIMNNLVIKSDSQEKNIKSQREMEPINRQALQNLTILDCFDDQQLTVTIHSIDRILAKNANISLLAMDSISAFFWADNMESMIKMDTYWRRMLKSLQSASKEYKTVIIFTRPSNFFSKGVSKYEIYENCSEEPKLEKINHRFILQENILPETETQPATKENYIKIQNIHGEIQKKYSINELGFVWD